MLTDFLLKIILLNKIDDIKLLYILLNNKTIRKFRAMFWGSDYKNGVMFMRFRN